MPFVRSTVNPKAPDFNIYWLIKEGEWAREVAYDEDAAQMSLSSSLLIKALYDCSSTAFDYGSRRG